MNDDKETHDRIIRYVAIRDCRLAGTSPEEVVKKALDEKVDEGINIVITYIRAGDKVTKLIICLTKVALIALSAEPDDNLIIVCKDPVQMKKTILKTQLTCKLVEVFPTYAFMQDLLKYRLQSKVSKLPPDEIKLLTAAYTGRDLPRIAIDDPVVKYFRGKEGDVFKFTRTNCGAGETIHCRMVTSRISHFSFSLEK